MQHKGKSVVHNRPFFIFGLLSGFVVGFSCFAWSVHSHPKPYSAYCASKRITSEDINAGTTCGYQ